MANSENLLSMTQGFMTPALIQNISGALSLPAGKVQAGLKSVLPTLLMGLADKGSSNEGAQSILNMTKNPTLQGPQAVNDIFGNELTTVSTSLGAFTGLSSSAVAKMFSLVAPLVMKTLERKVNQEKLGVSGLKGFLTQQKEALAEIVPTGISNHFGFGASNPSMGKISSSMKDVPHSAKPFPTTHSSTMSATTNKSWAPMVLLLAAILASLWWFTGGQNQMRLPAMNQTESQMER